MVAAGHANAADLTPAAAGLFLAAAEKDEYRRRVLDALMARKSPEELNSLLDKLD